MATVSAFDNILFLFSKRSTHMTKKNKMKLHDSH